MFESSLKKFVWTGKLEIYETKNSREEGGLGIICIRSKADALFLIQTCRLLASDSFNSFKHIRYWISEHEKWWTFRRNSVILFASEETVYWSSCIRKYRCWKSKEDLCWLHPHFISTKRFSNKKNSITTTKLI